MVRELSAWIVHLCSANDCNSAHSSSFSSTHESVLVGEWRQNWKYCLEVSFKLARYPLKNRAMDSMSFGKSSAPGTSEVKPLSFFQLMMRESVPILLPILFPKSIKISQNRMEGDMFSSLSSIFKMDVMSVVSSKSPNLYRMYDGGTSISASFLL